ncbi:uncharacterized protein CXorf49 homolog [Capricornis sumatraensis]|uniref:uncharacterized protein CXorf49 homolog n=1 Tax=Capricornis sumatraensis TaxID=34865 RepID=UPI003604C406
MSSPDDEVFVRGGGSGSECGEQTSGLEAGSPAPRGPGPDPGPEPGAPRSGEGEGGDGFPDSEGFELERAVLEAGEPVLSGCEGRPGSPADDTGYAVQLSDESLAAILQQLADLDLLGIRRHMSPERYAVGEVSALRDLEARPSTRGAAAQRCGKAAQAEAGPLCVGGPKAGRAWGNPKRGTKSRLNKAVDRQWPPSGSLAGLLSDSESSDECSEIQPMRVSIYPKDGGQAKLNSPKDPGDTPRHSNVQGRENLLDVPGTCLSSAPGGLISVVERQGRQGDADQEDISPPKKMQSVVRRKGGSLPSYPGVAAAAAAPAAATTARLPRPSPRRKRVQEKKAFGGVSKPALGRTFPSWGRGISAAPLDPATLPPIFGIPLLGRSKKYALVPGGTKESKHTGAGKKPVARRARESVAAVAVSGEDNDPNRDPVAKGQPTTDRPWPSCSRVHRGEPSSANPSIRGGQDSGNSEPVAMNKGEVMPRGPGPSGDQRPADRPPRPKRQQQPPGKQGCPRCVVLQREIDDLKEQLASMQYLAETFQIL